MEFYSSPFCGRYSSHSILHFTLLFSVVIRLYTHSLSLLITPSSFVRAQYSVSSAHWGVSQSHDFFSHFPFAFIRLCQSVFGWDFVIIIFFFSFSVENFVKHRSRLAWEPPSSPHTPVFLSDAFEFRVWVFVGFCVCFRRQRTSHTHIEIITQMWAELLLCIVCCLSIDRQWLYLYLLIDHLI